MPSSKNSSSSSSNHHHNKNNNNPASKKQKKATSGNSTTSGKLRHQQQRNNNNITRAPAAANLMLQLQHLASLPLHDALYLLYAYNPTASNHVSINNGATYQQQQQQSSYSHQVPLILQIHDSRSFDVLWKLFAGWVPSVGAGNLASGSSGPMAPLNSIFSKICDKRDFQQSFRHYSGPNGNNAAVNSAVSSAAAVSSSSDEFYSIPFDKLPWRLRERFAAEDAAMAAAAVNQTSSRTPLRQQPQVTSGASAVSHQNTNNTPSASITLNKFQYWMFCFAYFPLSVSRYTFSGKKSMTKAMNGSGGSTGRRLASSALAFASPRNLVRSSSSRANKFIENAYLELLKRYLDAFWNKSSDLLKREGLLSILIDYWLDVWTLRQEENDQNSSSASSASRSAAGAGGVFSSPLLSPGAASRRSGHQSFYDHGSTPDSRRSSSKPSSSQHRERVKFSPEFLEKSWNVIKCVQILVNFFVSDPKLKRLVDEANRSGVPAANTPTNAYQRQVQFATSGGYSSPLEKVLTRDLMRLQVPLFQFLHRTLTSWPRNLRATFPFYHLMELLITYIAPWRLHKDSKPADWIPYVRANWCFYSVLFVDALNVIATMHEDQGASYWKKASDLISIFVDKDVLNVMREVNSIFSDVSKRNNHNIRRRYSDVADHIILVLDDLSRYTPVFSSANITLARRLINKHVGMSNKWALSMQDKPPRTNIFDRLEEYLNSVFGGTKKEKKDCPEMKIHELLAMRIESVFKTGIDIPNLLFSRRDFASMSKTQSTKSLLLEPPEVDETGELTEEGKRQLAFGSRKCSKNDVHFVGDPLYAPATSYEIPLLVDITIGISALINQYLQRRQEGERRILGKRINLRFLSDWRVLVFMFVAVLVVFLVLVIIFLLFYILFGGSSTGPDY